MSETLKEAKPSAAAISTAMIWLSKEHAEKALKSFYLIDVAPLIAERDALKAAVKDLDAAMMTRGSAYAAGYRDGVESSIAASRRQVEGLKDAIRKTREIVSKCAAEGFVYDKAPLDELYANQAALTSAISALDAPQPEASPTPMESITELWADLEAVGVRREDKRDEALAANPLPEEMEQPNAIAPELLARLGDDAWKWAAEFRKTAVKLGYSDMDEGWLIEWFATAIEHSWGVRSISVPEPKPFDEITKEELLAGLEQLCPPAPEEIEVTPEMIAEGRRAASNGDKLSVDDRFASIYRAMRAKEPK